MLTRPPLQVGHPSPLAINARVPFVGSGVFTEADELLKQNGTEFKWSLE